MIASNSSSPSTGVRSLQLIDRLEALLRAENDRSTWMAEMFEHPYRFDFFQAVRRIEGLDPTLPRIGWAKRADQEILRIGQSVQLDFAPATIDQITRTATGRLRLQQRFLGLWGPSGALPLPMTESARDQFRHEGDGSQIAFADIFHHRIATLFYRVWSTSRGAIQRDRPHQDRFADYVASLAGSVAGSAAGFATKDARPSHVRGAALPPPLSTGRPQADIDPQPRPLAHHSPQDEPRRYHAARFGIRRNADGLHDLVSATLGVPVEVRTFVAASLRLRDEDHARLGRPGDRPQPRSTLGGGLILGRRVDDHASTIELRIGPINLASYRALMPRGVGHAGLRRLVRGYVRRGLQVRVRLVLAAAEKPSLSLGRSATVGRDSWLPETRQRSAAADYCFDL